MPSPLVLLQTSDWHVGSALTGRGLDLPHELREVRRDEVDAAPERAVAAARLCGADALVVPGDLWDAECVPASSIHRLLEALASFAPKPVFVAPGNHDFAGPGGWYDPSVLAALGMRPWPDNVRVFRETEWTSAAFPERPDVRVVGRAFPGSNATASRPLDPGPPRPGVPLAVLLLHGSYDSYVGPDAPRGAKKIAPFSREELLRSGFTWAALGHHHAVQIVTDDSGAPRAAYAGCPTGRGLDETGPRQMLKVTLQEDQPPAVESLPAGGRVVHDLSLEVSSLEGPTLLEEAGALLTRAGATGEDFVRLALTGVVPYGSRPSAAVQALASRVAHLVVRDRTEPPAARSVPGLETAEDRFVGGLRSQRERETDERARRVIDLALRLGRDALAGRSVAPPDVEEP